MQAGLVMDFRGGKVFVPDPIDAHIADAPWDVRFRLSVDSEGVPVVSELHLEQKPDGPPISASMLRDPRVSLGKAIELAIEQASTPAQWDGKVLRFSSELGDTKPGAARAVLKRQRGAVQMDELRRAVDVYKRALNKPGDTYSAVAEALNVSRPTAARRIQRARALGLLDEEVGK